MYPYLSEAQQWVRKRKQKQLNARWVARLIKETLNSHQVVFFLLLTRSRRLVPTAAHNDNSASCVIVVTKGDGVLLVSVETPSECHTVGKVFPFCQKDSPKHVTGN